MELRFQDPAFHENELTLKFLRSGKVVAKIGNGRSHYTLHPGTATGVIDFHKTDEKNSTLEPGLLVRERKRDLSETQRHSCRTLSGSV
jgi:hypothetical protein